MSRKKQAEYKKRSQLSIIWNRLRKNKLAMLGLAILVVMVALAVCADWIADYDTNVTGMNMAERKIWKSLAPASFAASAYS